MKIDAGQLVAAITQALEEYSDEIAEELKQAAKDCAKQCKNDAQALSPVSAGKYKKGWRVKTVFENKENIRLEISNKDKPQITHLLEHGHAKRGGGRVEARPHIKTAEQKAIADFEKRVKEAIK
ncbi:MAG: HK97 gp10 family phage protein [Angelakisella sp.]